MASLVSGGATYTIDIAPYASWSDTGGVMLTNGSKAWSDWRVGWLAAAAHPTIRIDLGSQYVLSHCKFYTSVWQPANVYAPSQVVISGSNDDSSYSTLGTFVVTTHWSPDNSYPSYTTSNDLSVSGTYRYIKFAFTNTSGREMSLNELEVYGDAVSSYSTPYYLKDRPVNRGDFSAVSVGKPNPTTAYPITKRYRW